MSENNAGEVVYLGKVKEQDGKFGSFMTGYISVDLVKQHGNGKYVSFVISKLKSPDDYGNTHSVKLSTYKPGEGAAKSGNGETAAKPAQATKKATSDETLVEEVAEGDAGDLSNIGF